MRKLSDIVHVERRFALSARLDADLNGTPPLTGYILQASVRKSLEAMLSGLCEGVQFSYTWTGPYGGGKSCAALLVANLVAGKPKQRRLAEEIVGADIAATFSLAFPGRGSKWDVLALTGRRASLTEAVAETAAQAFGWAADTIAAVSADDRLLIDALEQHAQSRGGLLIVIDELGKFLEHAAMTAGDVHLLQDLAERAARSQGKLVIVGILHQSFEQYGSRLGRGGREEWAKVQGRFQNVPFVALPDEVAALLARAIICDDVPENAAELAMSTARAISKRRAVDVDALGDVLSKAWPLHPVSSLLLGPLSRQRFAQNERSVFGFLSSAEPLGFQSHLASTEVEGETWYGPDKLWDYLVANFGTALTAGPDSNRMTLAIEAIERAGLRSELAARLIKSAAIIEFFRNGSGLSVADDILSLCVPETSIENVRSALDDLVNRAILIRQPRLGGYALFAGSDFDLDEAITQAAQKLSPEVLLNLPARLGIGPIAAKKHYFKTGALRVFDVTLQFVEETPQDVESWTDQAAASLAKSKRRSSGILVLLVMQDAAPREHLDDLAAKLGEKLELRGVLAAVAAADKVELLRDQAIDLHAIDRIEVSHPQLEGDRIARRELTSRRVQLTDAVRSELLDAFLSARWWILGIRNEKVDASNLSIVASTLAELAFHQAPVIQSELLYREKPSSSAMAGLRALAHAMVAKPHLDSLGIEGYPVERGLYLTILKPLGLHRESDDGTYGFTDPIDSDACATLLPAWQLLAEKEVRLSDLFDLWATRPFGIKRGVMPVLALAYLMTHRNNVALYVDGRYQAVVDDVVVDRLMQDAGAIEFRRISRSKRDEEFTRQLARLLSTNEKIVEPAALPVASSLYQRFHALPQWAQRTGTMSVKARQIRDVVLKASDPEALLFIDLPPVLEGETDPATAIAVALLTAEAAYPAMLYQFRIRLAEMLGVNADTFEGIGSRSITASGISADLRVEAFIMRTGAFEGGGDVEGLASLLVHKPPRNWSDREQEQALFEMAKLARRFREAEAFANVKGRAPTSKAISVVVGLDPNDQPLFHTFEVTEQEMKSANDVADDLLLALRGRGLRSAVELAALARVVERLSVGAEMEQI